MKVRERWISERSPPSTFVGVVAAEGLVVGKFGVWTVSRELAFPQTGSLSVSAAEGGGELGPEVLGTTEVKLKQGSASWLR